MRARVWWTVLLASVLAAAAVFVLAAKAAWLAALVAGVAVIGTAVVAVRLSRRPKRARPKDVKSVYVGNLPFRTREEELRRVFAQCGEVYRVRIVRHPQTRRSKGYAFVDMDPEGARRALSELDGYEFYGRKLKLGPAERDG